MLGWGIKKRVLFVAVVPGAAIAIGLVFYFLLLRYEDVETALASRGAALARQLAPAAEYGVFSGNRQALQRLAQAALREPDVAAVSFHDAHGALLALAGTPHAGGDPLSLPEGWTGHSPDSAYLFFHAKILRGGIDFDDPFQSGVPEPALLGSVTLEMSRSAVMARRREILVVTLLFTAALLAGATLLAYRLGRDVTEPVLALEGVVDRIHRGELAARVAHHPAGTLRMLEEGVNAMASSLEAALERSQAALADSEQELHRQHEFAQTLLQAQSDAGVGTVLVEGGRIVYANAMTSTIFGYSNEELLALPSFLELVHPVAREQERRDYRRRIAGLEMRDRYALPVVARDGTERIVEVATATLPGEQGRRMLSVVLDITQRKRDEALLAEAYDELKAKKEEAERASMAKSRFLAAASHDLRQPLHALTLFAAELEGMTTTPPQHRLAHQISTAAEAMGQLLEALLDISRLDMAGLATHREAFPLDPLLQRVAANNQDSARARGLRLACARTSAWTDSDAQMLERMLSNLVGNAIRYTPRGAVLIGVRRDREGLRIEVRDSGIGIAEEHLPHVFQEFYQVANEERDAGKGLGLGLAIVDRLARALDHRVTVRSRPGAGSTFSIQVPRARPAPAAMPAEEAGQGSEIAAIRVLVVSTNRPVCESLGALLRSWGCQVEEARDSAEIAGALQGALPDAVVCDDCCIGVTVRQLQKLPAHPPLVLLGEAPTSEAVATAIDGRLSKPVRPARLRALLRHLLEEKGVTA